MTGLVNGHAPVPVKFSVPGAEQKTVRNYLRRVIRRKRGSRPVAKTARSIGFDADMYDLFVKNGRQYISLMSLKPRKRIIVPLSGNTPIVGNIRIGLDFWQQRLEVHYSADVKTPAPLEGEVVALDAGVSEVFTDEQGRHYGPEFGQAIGWASDEMCARGRMRNKLYQLAKKTVLQSYVERLDPSRRPALTAKARHIRKFNLGRQKQRTHQCRQHREMEQQINTVINQIVAQRRPAVLITEKLDIRGKAKSKKMARRVSLWMRGILKERVQFKASAKGFRREQVNPAYTSQLCPACGFAYPANRHGDTFKCLHCGHIDDADRVAAINLKARWFDHEISLYTREAKVKEILLARFNARLKRDGRPAVDSTVSGRTPGDLHCRSRRRAKRPSQSRLARENDGARCDQGC